MQISNIIDKIRLDPPFSIHRPNPFNKSVLIGGQAGELINIFEEIYNLSLVNPLITSIVGHPGTGKTHFLWNLEHRTNQHERDGVVLIYELKDKIPSYSDLINFVYSHENFRNSVTECGIKFDDTIIDDVNKMTFEINNIIEQINQNHGNFGICIGVDGIDEYVRGLVYKKKWTNEKVIVDLLGTFRLILDGIDKICIIFALTVDVFTDMMPIISSDQTLRRRFLIANGVDGRPVEFGQFSENEAYILVSTFMKHWAQRNDIDIDHIANGNETWPFEKKSIKLAWRIGVTPGTISFTCMDALLEKINNKISSINDFTISELDIAKSLKKNKSYSHYTGDKKAWNDIDFLINESAIKEKIYALKVQAGKEMDDQFDILSKNAFEKYLSDLGFSIKFGLSDLLVGTDFEHFSKVVAVRFIDGLTIYKKDAQDSANDIFSLKANAVLFICILDQNISEKSIHNKVKYQKGFELMFKNLTSRVDYNSTLLSQPMNRDDLLQIIGLQKLEETERRQLVEFLDKRLKFKTLLDSLMFTEPSKIPERDNYV